MHKALTQLSKFQYKDRRNEARKEDENLLYGLHPILEALQANKGIERILIKKGIDPETRKQISEAAKASDVPCLTVPVEKLDNILRGKNHQGVAAYAAEIHYTKLEDLIASLLDREIEPFLIALDGVTDVRNFGAIARSAECLGAHGILLPSQGSVRINAEAVRVSSGALHYLPVCRMNHLADGLFYLKASGIRLISIQQKAKNSIYEADLSGPVCFVFGSEGEGISPKIQKICDDSVLIPMAGKITSLNVSVAAGVVLAFARANRSQEVDTP